MREFEAGKSKAPFVPGPALSRPWWWRGSRAHRATHGRRPSLGSRVKAQISERGLLLVPYRISRHRARAGTGNTSRVNTRPPRALHRLSSVLVAAISSHASLRCKSPEWPPGRR